MSNYGMYPDNTEEVRRWQAERENASAKVRLAMTKNCCKLLISQKDPVNMLGIDREKLKVLLDFVQHHDSERLREECEALMEPPR